jgi:transposase-like protein
MTPKPFADQRTPALAIVARGDQIEDRSATEFAVRSQSRPETIYEVSVRGDKWSCGCAFFTETKLPCIHILAVRYRAGFGEAKAPASTAKPVCERCRSTVVVKAGVRRNKSGPVARYVCRTCGATFTGRQGYHKRRSDPEMIAKALDLYFRGVSFRQVADHFSQVYGLRLSPMTVYRWVTHFGKLAAEWMDKQGAQTGERWHIDETVVSVDGDKRWVWNVLDAETRFLLATHVSANRSIANTRAPIHKAKQVASKEPEEILTDGMTAYPEAIRKEFGRYRRPGDTLANWKIGSHMHYSPHRVVPSIRAPESNNLVERLHGSEKDRIRPMRGFDTMDGTAALMEGYRAHYNLVRRHIALGTTPGLAAGLPDLGGFRWRTLIDLAVRRNDTPGSGVPESAD